MQQMQFNPFMTEAVIIQKPMDWFLYDNGLRHERVKEIFVNYGNYNIDGKIIFTRPIDSFQLQFFTIQTKYSRMDQVKLQKTAFKKFEVIWSIYTDKKYFVSGILQNNCFEIPSKIPRKTFMAAFGSFVFGSLVKLSKIDSVHRRSHLRCSATLLKKRLQYSYFTLKFTNFLRKPLVAASFFRAWACLKLR